MNETEKPYVVTSDLAVLMQRWAANTPYRLPDEGFFTEATDAFLAEVSRCFPTAEEIKSRDLIAGLRKLIQESELPVISLDRAYIDDKTAGVWGHLDVTRSMVPIRNGIKTRAPEFQKLGLGPRPGTASLDLQILMLAKGLPQPEIALVDDWVFGGQTNLEIISLFAQHGLTVKEVIAGISIPEGRQAIEAQGVAVKSWRAYGEIIDGMCQRDHFAGTPLSGRTVVTGTSTPKGAPYFLPFGDPTGWSSVPENEALNFSQTCMMLSIALWSEIEKLSRTKISTHQLPKMIYGLTPNISVVKALEFAQKRTFDD